MAKVEYTKATQADHDELLDLVNYVFSIDFLEVMPKLYKPEYNKAGDHYIVKENGRIKAAVGSFPMDMLVCGEHLKVRGIGSVSVHRYSRRKGYMKTLMEKAMEDMKKENVDLACLAGRRQRYAYFSFEPCGPVLEFSVISENIKHVYGDNRSTGIVFKMVEPDDNEVLNGMCKMHDQQPNHVIRKGNFYDVLKTWNSLPYAIYQDGRLTGYIVADSRFQSVSELVLDKQVSVEPVVREIFYTFKPEKTVFKCAPWQRDQIVFLETIAERCSIAQNENFTVLNYINVLRALMKLKASYTSLADGELTLCVSGVQSLKITVHNGESSVEEYSGKCEVVLPHLQAMRFLFSPMSSFCDFSTEVTPEVRSWFPLPLFFPEQDKV